MSKIHGDNWFDLNNPYTYRDDNLRAMGFKSYDAYLRSPLWASIRMRVLERCQTKCECCRKRMAAQIHHRAYDPATLRGDSIDSLTATCPRCHIKAEHRRRPRRLRGWIDNAERAHQRFRGANDAILKGIRKQAKKEARVAGRVARLVKVPQP